MSIANHREMTFLHFMLSTRWRSNDTRTFIGKYEETYDNDLRGQPFLLYILFPLHSSHISFRFICKLW